jgi:STE24 endopeptidase
VPDRRLDRRAAWALLGATVVVWALAAAFLVPWDWVPGGSLTPARASAFFSPDQLERARSYVDQVRPLSYAAYATALAVACAFGFTRSGSRLSSALGRRSPAWVAVPVLVLVLELLASLATAPFGLLVRRRNLAEGLTHQSLAGWLTDRALSVLVSAVLMTAIVALVLLTARRWPRRWFVPAAGVAVVLSFGVSMLYPVVVEPLFNRFTPLPDGPLRSAVLRLADEEGVHVDDVLVADASRRTTTLNAYVSGFGGTRRVVLYDNLLHGVPRGQVEAVVAHELGHARNHDVLIGTTLAALGSVAGVVLLALLLDSGWMQRRAAFSGAHDPRNVAAVLALVAVGGFLVSPLQNTVSRAIEARADRTGLEATRDPASFEALQRRLALRSLADPDPPWLAQLWFGTHPTVVQRLGLPASLARARDDG